MKILVIGKRNHLKWDHHVFSAFKNLGHDVKHIQVNNRPLTNQFSRVMMKAFYGKQKGSNLSNQMYIKSLQDELNDFKPNLVFFTSGLHIPIEFYSMAKTLKSKPFLFSWDGDGLSNHQNSNIYNDYIDVLFDIEEEFVKSNINKFKRIELLPFATNKYFYKNLGFSRLNKFYFCGAWTQERDDIFSELTEYQIIFRGGKWNRLSKISSNFDINTSSKVNTYLDYNKYSSVINIHQSDNTPISGLNMRVFEVPSCASLLINDYRKGIENFFDIEKEICVYKNINELKEIMDRVKTDIKEFNIIRENGYRRVISEHTYEHRMKRVIEIYDQL